MADIGTKQTALYRFFDEHDELLYVGITYRIESRLAKHRQSKPWSEIARIEVEHYPTRKAARAAELEAIRNEQPKWNVADKPGSGSSPAFVVEWKCAACKKPVADNKGYIHISYRDINDREERYEEWRAAAAAKSGNGQIVAISLSWLMECPEPARWNVHHSSCDPKPDAPDYWFGVERARTWDQLLGWCAHLMGKDWLDHTNWDAFLRWALKSNGKTP